MDGMPPFRMPYRAIGSAYLIRQAPGAEEMGGLEIVLRRSEPGKGVIKIIPTARRTGEDLADEISYYAEHVIRGIREVAERHSISLENYDLELTAFLHHDVDSRATCFYQAGKSAFRSALEMWTRSDLSISD